MSRTVLKVAGENGMGLSSVGEIVQKALKKAGFYLHSEREFPSTIKGGVACNVINFSDQPIHALSKTIDLALGLDREGVRNALDTLKPGGVLIHGFDRWNKVIKDLPNIVEEKNLKVYLIPGREIALEKGGSFIMVNTVLLGFLWKMLQLPFDSLKEQIVEQFADKPNLIEVNLACAQGGFEYQTEDPIPTLSIKQPVTNPDTILVDGNVSLALGAIQAGVRAYYAYPMSPSTSILVYLAKTSHETGIIVKQAEDEITAVQMALGSMHMGTRAWVATSGGGYDLMTETISLSGMIETPLVVTICQRPGPATGLPTWTAQGDLNLALYSSHGEFPRVVVACSDPESAFEIIQHAFNLAETYQLPVIVLTEATIAMSQTTVPIFSTHIDLQRGLVDDSDLEALQPSNRYQITETGISKRWLPGTSKAVYFANGDEHWESGELTEDGSKVKEMIDKRLRKLEQVTRHIGEPKIYGPAVADISFVGWGSSKTVMLDVIQDMAQQGISVNYLHYEWLWPLKTEALTTFYKTNTQVHLIEGNHEGQLGNLLEGKTGITFKGRLLKWDGRPFYIEDVSEYISSQMKKRIKVSL